MTTENAGATLRDTLTAAVEEVETRDTVPTATTDAVVAETDKEPAEAKTTETTQGRTAGRPRDDKGRLLPGKGEKSETAPQAATEAPAATSKPRPAYPSTWKKDYAPKWETVDPDLAEEIHRRESDFAKGVSTYKAEYDRVKPLEEAIKAYLPQWQQAGVNPDVAVKNLAETDRVLRSGSKEEKLRLMAYMAQSYNIPLHEMLVQGEDGKVYFNQQFMQQQPQQPQGITPQQVQAMLDQRLAQVRIQEAIAQFTSAKDSSGNPLYPHFEQVKATMDGLLRAGLANDLPSAYAKALKFPEHAPLIEAQQKQQRETEQAAAVKEKAEAAARARANTVSTKSSSTTGAATATTGKGKGLRDSLSEAFDIHVGSSRI